MKRTPRKAPSHPAPARKTRKRSSPPRPVAAARGQTILRLRAVMARTGLSRSQIYRVLGSRRISLGRNSAGWLESDIDAWITERIAASRGAAAAAE